MDLKRNNGLRSSWFVVLAIIGSVRCQFLSTPFNTAVKSGERAVLTCTRQNSKDSHTWTEFVTNLPSGTRLASDGIPVNQHPWSAQVEFENHFDLVFPAVTSSNAGALGCSVQAAGGTIYRKFAMLMVTEKPTCSVQSTIESDINVVQEGISAKITCTVRYTGLWGPSMELYDPNSNLLQSNMTNPAGVVSYSSTITPSRDMDGLTSVCALYYQDVPDDGRLPIGPDWDQLPPDFSDRCNTPFTVQYSPAPDDFNITFSKANDGPFYRPGDTIFCEAPGNPAPSYSWRRWDENCSDCTGNGPSVIPGSLLTMNLDYEGVNRYVCVAGNNIGGENVFVSTSPIIFEVRKIEKSDDGGPNIGAIVGGALGGIVGILLILIVVFLVLRRNSPETLDKFKRGIRKKDKFEDAETSIGMSAEALAKKFEGNRKEEDRYSKSPFKFLTKGKKMKKSEMDEGLQVSPERINLISKLGEGSFGQVWKGEIWGLDGKNGTSVAAVKTLKENASDKDKSDLLGEIKVMESLPPHPNVVQLLGFSTKADPIMVIVEFCSEGNLLDFLRKNRSMHNYAKSDGEDALAARLLLSFAYQAAQGMGHLSNRSLLHRDLAARNVLIAENDVCKISDFGLSRDVVDRNVYTRESQGPLPVRWMAPESLFDNIYTTKSDVWSFGVLLWEIVTLGSTPYPGMSSRQVMQNVKQKKLMDKPEHCMDDVFEIMKHCWEFEAEKRPTFDELAKTFSQFLEEENDYIALSEFQEDIYTNMPSNVSDEKV